VESGQLGLVPNGRPRDMKYAPVHSGSGGACIPAALVECVDVRAAAAWRLFIWRTSPNEMGHSLSRQRRQPAAGPADQHNAGTN
jgi:hypothetical protein